MMSYTTGPLPMLGLVLQFPFCIRQFLTEQVWESLL